MSFVNEKPFSIHIVGELTGETFTGDFTALKFLPSTLVFKQDQLLRGYLAGENPLISNQIDRAGKLAKVQTCVSESPEWWKECGQGAGLIDFNVVEAVYDKVVEIQKGAMDAVKAKAEKVAKDLAEAAEEAAAKK